MMCCLFHPNNFLSLALSLCLSLSHSPSVTDSATMESPQLSPFSPKGPLCMSPSFQMSTLSLPGQAPSPLQSPILSEVGTARLDEDEEGRRKVQLLSHAILLLCSRSATLNALCLANAGCLAYDF